MPNIEHRTSNAEHAEACTPNMTETEKLEVLAEANRLRHAEEVAALRRENQTLRDALYDRFGVFVTTINSTKKRLKQTMNRQGAGAK